jgi:hypothetical protein
MIPRSTHQTGRAYPSGAWHRLRHKMEAFHPDWSHHYYDDAVCRELENTKGTGSLLLARFVLCSLVGSIHHEP